MPPLPRRSLLQCNKERGPNRGAREREARQAEMRREAGPDSNERTESLLRGGHFTLKKDTISNAE